MEPHNAWSLDYHLRTDFDFSKLSGLNASILVAQALSMGISVEVLEEKFLSLRRGDKEVLFRDADNTTLSYLAATIVRDKRLTRLFLERGQVPVPKGKAFSPQDTEGIQRFVAEIGSVVIKPADGECGQNVYCGVTSDNINGVLSDVQRQKSPQIVEEFVQGQEYRIFATVRGDISVILRRPASVLGDDKKTIADLVEEKNEDRQEKGEFPITSPYSKIKIDDVVRFNLASQGFGVDYVPKHGERTYLRSNSNLSTGGDSIAIEMEEIDLPVRDVVQKIFLAIPGLSYAGIDLITPDIKHSGPFWIIEINEDPGLRGMAFPYQGKAYNPAKALLDLAFEG